MFKYIKRIITMMLAIIILFCVIPIETYATVSEISSKNENWYAYESVGDGEIEIIGFKKKSYDGEIKIPEEIDQQKVVGIGENAFCDRNDLTGNLILPEGLNYIGENAFSNCGISGDLVIPDSVVSIGYMAFSGCRNLTGNLSLSNNITIINPYTFDNCGFTGEVRVGNDVNYIGEYAFLNCTGLEKIYLPDSFYCGEYAFSYLDDEYHNLDITVTCKAGSDTYWWGKFYGYTLEIIPIHELTWEYLNDGNTASENVVLFKYLLCNK